MVAAGLSPSTAHHAHAVLHRALADAVRWGLVGRNVAGLMAAPRMAEHQMQAPSGEQARAFLAAAQGDRFEALYVLAISTGMRQGELLALHWRDVDPESWSLSVTASLQRDKGTVTMAEPKTPRSRRKVALATQAVEALRRHRQVQAAERLAAGPLWQDLAVVFANEGGAPVNRDRLITRSFNPLLAQAGLSRIRFHDYADVGIITISATRRPPCCWPKGSTRRSPRRCWGTPTSRSPSTATPTSARTCNRTPPA